MSRPPLRLTPTFAFAFVLAFTLALGACGPDSGATDRASAAAADSPASSPLSSTDADAVYAAVDGTPLPADFAHEPSAPHVAVDPRGRAAIVFVADDDPWVALSRTDGGWDDPVRLAGPGRVAWGTSWGPKVAFTGRGLVVTATCGEQAGSEDGDLYAWHSTHGGGWSEAARITDVDAAAREGMHAMAASPSGQVLCTWLDLRTDSTELWAARSSDGGATWSADALVYRSPDGSICECCPPAAGLDPRGGRPLLIFRNALGGARDLQVVLGLGEDWHTRPLGHEPWEITGCPVAGPDFALSPGGAWRSVYRVGMRLESVDHESLPFMLAEQGRWPRVAFGGDAFVYLWVDRDGQLVWRRETDAADVLSSLGEGHAPWLAGAAGGLGPVVAVWETAGEGAARLAVTTLVPRATEEHP